MISFLALVEVMAGEFGMEALAAGAVRVLSGKKMAKNYTGKPVCVLSHQARKNLAKCSMRQSRAIAL